MSVSDTEAKEILAALGAGPAALADDECDALDRDGYAVLDGALDAATVAAMRSVLEKLLEIARRDPTRKHGGTLHLDDILDSGAAFDPAWTSPRLLAAVAADAAPGSPSRTRRSTGSEPRACC
ncbi:MAG: phytanoyl-CoA dioxygenase family protein [Candidatus Eremiobacteraeota bacterium]|nr:phytanoyl-CoA dioxygenase family protein [Candidatus Eremiobacteraeota bacterium]